jgi:hypothetical protein
MKGSEARVAPRFTADMPVLAGGGQGVARDLSSSGVFFETNGSFSAGQPIEFSIVLEHLYPDRPVRLNCKGSIVRVEQKGTKVGVATTIDSYTIEDHVQ